MRRLAQSTVLFLAALPCFGLAGLGQTIPAIQAKALDGSQVSLPAAGDARPLLLMIGFSHQSSKEFDAWDKHLLPSYLSSPAVAFYQVVELQAAPSLVRPMILHSMRGQIHGAESSRYVPIFSEEQKWKSAAGYSAPDDAYLMLCDPSGRIAWQTHGAPDAAKLSELKAALARLAPSAAQ